MTDGRGGCTFGSVGIVPPRKGDGMPNERGAVSWAAEVIADDSGKFCGNALRFATYEEAEQYALDLSWRWTLVVAHRVVRSQDPVNRRWEDGKLVAPDALPIPVRGPMAHEVTIISAERGIEVGVVEGNNIRVTARPVQPVEG